MGATSAVVKWDPANNQPVVVPDPIPVPRGAGATVIHWTCDASVSRFSISGLDPAVFHPASSAGMGTQFSTTDANATPGTYEYNVDVQLPGGATAGQDPRIQNGG